MSIRSVGRQWVETALATRPCRLNLRRDVARAFPRISGGGTTRGIRGMAVRQPFCRGAAHFPDVGCVNRATTDLAKRSLWQEVRRHESMDFLRLRVFGVLEPGRHYIRYVYSFVKALKVRFRGGARSGLDGLAIA